MDASLDTEEAWPQQTHCTQMTGGRFSVKMILRRKRIINRGARCIRRKPGTKARVRIS